MSHVDPIQLVEDLIHLAGAVARAIRRGEPEKASAILPQDLRTSLARAAAEDRARGKFGPAAGVALRYTDPSEGHQ